MKVTAKTAIRPLGRPVARRIRALRRRYLSEHARANRARIGFRSWLTDTQKMMERYGLDRLSATFEGREVFIKATSGLDFLFPQGYGLGLRHLEFNGTNDRIQLEFISHNFSGNSVFLDVGASYGYYGLSVANMFPGSEVHCFEPIDAPFAHLTRNIERNGLPNVNAWHTAVGGGQGSIPLDPHKGFVGTVVPKEGGVANPVMQRLLSLDHFVKEQNVSKVGYIKIDVEGFEMEVLRGAEAILDRDRPIVQCETGSDLRDYGHSRQGLFDFFSGRGYRSLMLDSIRDLTGVGKPVPTPGDAERDQSGASEFFFYPEEHPLNLEYESAFKDPIRLRYV